MKNFNDTIGNRTRDLPNGSALRQRNAPSRTSDFYSCPIVTKLEFFPQIFEKYSNIKFYENPSSGSRVVPCGQTDMTKPIVAFRNFVNAPEDSLYS